MDIKNNKNNFVCKESPSVCPSLRRVTDDIKVQIDYECFGRTLKSGAIYIDQQVDEICLIIAEVMVLPAENKIKINSEVVWVGVVQEIYGKLTYEHVQLVLEKFKEVTDEIRNKKAYLRTALYNSVFEYDSHYVNQVSHDFY